MSVMELRVVGAETDDDQRCALGAVYRLEHAAMPFAVWNGEKFVGPRERAHLRLLETLSRAEGGWVEYVGDIAGILLVPELESEHCATCDWDVSLDCKPRGHRIETAMVPNRELLTAIDAVTAPWLDAQADARCAEEVDAILIRALRWEGDQGYPYVPSTLEAMSLRRRLGQDLSDDDRAAILNRFPQLEASDE
jgi:hypothetical protein